MKKLNVFNSENEIVTIVINFDQDIIIQPKQTIQIETDSSFNSDNFYVEGDLENNWDAKYINDERTNLKLFKKYIPEWND
jgi:hypothetical protein